MSSKENSAILLLGHGSRDPESVQEFLNFADGFQNYNGFRTLKNLKITSAFLELSEPSIPHALEQLAQQGINEIVAIPYLLFRAGHVKTEIPEMLKEFREHHPEIKIFYENALWPHKNLTELAKLRIHQTLTEFKETVKGEVDLLVVGRGATDPEATQQFEEATEKLCSQIACRKFHHCYIDLAEPRYTQALPEMFQNGTKQLLIFPFYLFTGILVKRIEIQAKEAVRNFRGVTIKVAPYFGSHPLMFQMLQDKINRAVSEQKLGVR